MCCARPDVRSYRFLHLSDTVACVGLRVRWTTDPIGFELATCDLEAALFGALARPVPAYCLSLSTLELDTSVVRYGPLVRQRGSSCVSNDFRRDHLLTVKL
jgi:hypothetical protein